jgi:biotin synthase
MTDILSAAREQVLDEGVPLEEAQALAVLELPDDRVPDALALAHEVRMRWCGPEVEVEGIVSIKTGGCPEDCHFCSQSGRFHTPVRAVRLDVPALVQAADATAATGATEFCLVAAVRGPDERLMAQAAEAVVAIRSEVEINIACSLGILTRGQRAEFAHQLSEIAPDEVPLNFLDPRPGTPFSDLPVVGAQDALRTIAAFRLALPRTVLRLAGGRELALGDLGTRDGMLGGINAMTVGNYLTTLGRSPERDLDLLTELAMPVKALSETL